MKARARALLDKADSPELRLRLLEMGFPRWNVRGGRRGRFAAADSFVVSIPKSGRTWLRVFIGSYWSRSTGRPFSAAAGPAGLHFTHDRWEAVTTAHFDQFLLGGHLIPARVRRAAPVVLLSRDPRDVVVSLYFQLTKREHRFQGTVSEMMKHPTFGIRPIIEIMNRWIDDFSRSRPPLFLRYEDCRADPMTHFRNMLEYLGIWRPESESLLEQAVEFAGFDNVQRMEKKGGFTEKFLKPGKLTDPQSFKTRRGKIGGFTDYLDDDDMRYAARAMASLSPRYGYAAEPATT